MNTGLFRNKHTLPSGRCKIGELSADQWQIWCGLGAFIRGNVDDTPTIRSYENLPFSENDPVDYDFNRLDFICYWVYEEEAWDQTKAVRHVKAIPADIVGMTPMQVAEKLRDAIREG